ncbi:hypothetical protein BD626DRAFT_539750 [Schizophyllum amplum]|uniref:Uncharacterized protein n=1 Tax=Schizophyllum amplum TaxID=97359 RepID=A0A550C2E0_9AGAR|nr:hypothetical protein BD626DRAFT_539750 [Auriculariopsis ampla]
MDVVQTPSSHTWPSSLYRKQSTRSGMQSRATPGSSSRHDAVGVAIEEAASRGSRRGGREQREAVEATGEEAVEVTGEEAVEATGSSRCNGQRTSLKLADDFEFPDGFKLAYGFKLSDAFNLAHDFDLLGNFKPFNEDFKLADDSMPPATTSSSLMASSSPTMIADNGFKLSDDFGVVHDVKIANDGLKLADDLELTNDDFKLADDLELTNDDFRLVYGSRLADDFNTPHNCKPFANDFQLADGYKLPADDGFRPADDGVKLPDGFQLPDGFKLSIGSKLASNFQFADGFKLSGDFELAHGLKLADDDYQLPKGFKPGEDVGVKDVDVACWGAKAVAVARGRRMLMSRVDERCRCRAREGERWYCPVGAKDFTVAWGRRIPLSRVGGEGRRCREGGSDGAVARRTPSRHAKDAEADIDSDAEVDID